MADEQKNKIDPNDFVGYMKELSKSQGGCSCVTVKDGHFIMMSRSMLMRSLNDPKNKDADEFLIFIKRRDMPQS